MYIYYKVNISTIFIDDTKTNEMSFLKVKDQQEAERKKVMSQEIQQALSEQTKFIAVKQKDVMEDLSKVEPAVIEAQQGIWYFCVTVVRGGAGVRERERVRERCIWYSCVTSNRDIILVFLHMYLGEERQRM